MQSSSVSLQPFEQAASIFAGWEVEFGSRPALGRVQNWSAWKHALAIWRQSHRTLQTGGVFFAVIHAFGV
jgi:hypothetical protein